MQNYTLYGQ